MSARRDRVSDLIPFVQVADVGQSIGFYKLLGFGVADTHEHDGRLDWAALMSDDAQLMLARTSAPTDHAQQAVLFYLYADDLDGLREHLLASGLPVGEIVDGSPGPEREMALADPDGYCLMIAENQGEQALAGDRSDDA